MKRRIAAFLPIVAMAAVAIPMTTAAPAFAGAGCGTTAADKDGSAWNKTADGANQRSGSSTGCGVNGIAYNAHQLDYHCYTRIGSSSETWTYLRNVSTGVSGWVRDDLLSDGGSLVYCGF